MTNILTQLGLIFFASVVFMLLALRLRLQPVVGLLLAGAIIGPNMLGLVNQSESINIFAEIGAILLLFFVGIKFSISKIVRMGLRPLAVWAIKDAFVFIVVYEASLLLGLDETTSLILGSTLAISSTTFFIKLIEEKNISTRQESNLIFVVLLLEDLLAVFLLAIYSGMGKGSASDLATVLISILRALLILTIAYMVLQRVIRALFDKLREYHSDEVMLFLALSFAIMLSFSASFIGLTPSIGAFLAGSILSTVKGFRKTENTLSKFSMLFSAFFFLSIGMQVNLVAMMQNVLVIGTLFFVVSVAIFSSVFVSSYLFGYRSQSAVRTGLLILAIGEFSLLIATQTRELVAPFDIVSITSALVFLTALSSRILIKYDKTLDAIIITVIHQRVKEAANGVSLYLNEVLNEFEPGGLVYITLLKEGMRSTVNIIFVVLIAVSGALAYMTIKDSFPEYATWVLAIAILLAIIPIVNIAFSLKKLLDSLARAFHKAMGENLTLDDMAMRDSAIAMFFFVVAVITPLLVSLLKLPKIFGMFFVVPLMIALLFVWNLATTVKKIMFRQKSYHSKKMRMTFKPPHSSSLRR